MSVEEKTHYDGPPTCHVCESLLPLLNRINRQLQYLQSQKPTNGDEEGLRCDLDKVFDSLYSAIDRRETEIFSLIDERGERLQSENDLAGLLEHLENAKSYSDKALVNTTKPELLALTGMIHDRAEELLDERSLEELNQKSDITFENDGFQDLLSEVENFGKIFNEKDVNAAVMERTFPQEHCAIDSDLSAFTDREIPASDRDELLTPDTGHSLKTALPVGDTGTHAIPFKEEQPDSDSNSEGYYPDDESTDAPSKADEMISDLKHDDSQDPFNTNQNNRSNEDPDFSPSDPSNQVTDDEDDTRHDAQTGDQNYIDSNAGYSEHQARDPFSSRRQHLEEQDENIESDSRNPFQNSLSKNEENGQDKESFQDSVDRNEDYGHENSSDGANQPHDEDLGSPQQSSYPFSNIPTLDDPKNLQDDDINNPQNVSRQRSSNPFSNSTSRASVDDSHDGEGDGIHHLEDNGDSQTDAHREARNPYNGQFVYDYSPDDTPDDGYEISNDEQYPEEISPKTGSHLQSDPRPQDDDLSDLNDQEGPKQTPLPINPQEIFENYRNSRPSEDNILDSSCINDCSEPLSPTSLNSFNSNLPQDDSAPRIHENPREKLNKNDGAPIFSYDSQPNSDGETSQFPQKDNQTLSCDLADEEGHPKEDEKGQQTLLDLLGQEPSAASALRFYINSNYTDVPGEDTPANKDTMIYGLELDPDSEQDAILTISPKMYSVEHIIKCGHIEFDKATAFEENHVTRDGKLINEPPIIPSPSTSWRFKNYKGALSTRPLDSTGMSYLEFWTSIEIKQTHDGRSLIFEAAVADRDVIDLYHKAEGQIHAWGVSLSHCPEHNGLCRRTWAAGTELQHYPDTLPNKAKTTAQLRFGFLLLQKQKKLIVIDCNHEKVLMTAENIKITRPLWPVFGVYNTELSYVETTLVSSGRLNIDQNIAWLILQNI